MMKSKNEFKKNSLLAQEVSDQQKGMSDYPLSDAKHNSKIAEINAIMEQEEMMKEGDCNILELLKVRMKHLGQARYIPSQSDQITQLGLMLGSQKREIKRLENFDWIFKLIYEYPAPYILSGGQLGHGKTDFSLLSVEKAMEYNVVEEVAGNIESVDLSDYPEVDYEYLTNWNELDNWVDRNRKNKVFIHDEATQNLDKRNPMSSLVKKYTHKGELFRKHNAHAVLICPNPDELDKRFRTNRLTNCTFEKASKKMVKIESKKNQRLSNALPRNPIRYRDIPESSIPFDTHEVAMFELDEGNEQGERIKKKHIQIWKDYQGTDNSQRDLADQYDLSVSTVNEAIQKVDKVMVKD